MAYFVLMCRYETTHSLTVTKQIRKSVFKSHQKISLSQNRDELKLGFSLVRETKG